MNKTHRLMLQWLLIYTNSKFPKHILQEKMHVQREGSLDQPLLEMMQVASFLPTQPLPDCLFEFFRKGHFIGKTKGCNCLPKSERFSCMCLKNKCESEIWYGQLIQISFHIKIRSHISWDLTRVRIRFSPLWVQSWPLRVNPPPGDEQAFYSRFTIQYSQFFMLAQAIAIWPPWIPVGISICGRILWDLSLKLSMYL